MYGERFLNYFVMIAIKPFAYFVYKAYWSQMHRFFLIYVSTIVACLGAGLSYAFMRLDREAIALLGQEDGVIEVLTAIAFAVTGLFSFCVFLKNRKEIWGLFTAFMGLAAAREMDWHKALTSDSVLKIKFYLREDIPITEKMFGLAVLGLIVFLVFRLAHYAGIWVRNIFRGRPESWAVFIALGMIFLAKMLDFLKRIVPPLEDFHVRNAHILGLCEESLELSSAMIFLFVCLCAFKTSQQQHRELQR